MLRQRTYGPKSGLAEPRSYRIALWTPLPPLKSGVADYMEELLPFLHKRYDVEIFVDEGYQVSPDLQACYKVFSCRVYEQRRARLPFDMNVYQMGNDAFHLYVYKQLLREPGLVVLHEISISSLLYNYYATLQHNMALFRQEFQYSEGEYALRIVDDYVTCGKDDALLEFFAQHPMLGRVLERNFAFVTHLQYSTQLLKEKYHVRNTYTMYLGSPDPLTDHADTMGARRALAIPDEKFVIGVAGYLQGNKQIEVCLRAVARLKNQYPHILLALIGPINPHGGYEQQLLSLIDRLEIWPFVRLTGYVPKSQLVQYLIGCDVQVSLRYPPFGEMSSTLSCGIAAGKPVIITDVPQWRFFPQDFCWRVPHEDTEGLQLEQYIRTLIENPALTEASGRHARDFYLREGSTEQAAERLIDIIDDVIRHVPQEVILKDSPDAEPLSSFITRAYEHALGRTPSRAEITALVGYLREMPTLAGASTLIHAIFDGPEFRSRAVTPFGYVIALHQVILGRPPSLKEVTSWVAEVLSRFNPLIPVFVNSSEFQRLIPDCQDHSVVTALVTRLYRHISGWTPGEADLAWWTDTIMGTCKATCDLVGAIAEFLNSPEYLSVPRTLAQHVTSLYRSLLAREPDAGGLERHVNTLAGQLATVENAFINSPEFHIRFQSLLRSSA